MMKRLLSVAAAAAAIATGWADPLAAQTLKAVMHADVANLDPINTTAYISRNHGYMIYDTLFAMDAEGRIQPQMVDHWEVSGDQLTYSFTLRDGLKFHDGAPVTANDAVASIRRWASRDAMGGFMMRYVASLDVVDAKTFKLVLKEPYGLVLLSLGKPSSNVPFIVPARVAATPGTEQITDFTGSGPFVFATAERRPGALNVYLKNQDYVPRKEPSSWTAGGKVVKVDRVEWITSPDQQSTVNALIAGEIDLIEAPAHDLLPILEAESDSITLFNWNPLGNQYMMRFNSLTKPFDNPKIRLAALYALNQDDFLKAAIGDERYYKTCAAMFVCGTPFATDVGGEILLKSDFEKSKQLLAEAGYDGTPVLLMHSTDLAVLTNLAPVAKQLLERGGFKVDMQSMNWGAVVARRAKMDPSDQGGWSAFMTSWVAADILNPISAAALNATGKTGFFGWFDIPQLETLKKEFATAPTLDRQKEIAATIQIKVNTEWATHAYLGQWDQPMAYRKNISNVPIAPAPLFWNIEKKD